MRKTLLLMGILFCSVPAMTQVTVSLGTYDGNGSTNVLLSTSTTVNRYSRTISLYTASEIVAEGGMAGVITSLAWDKHGTGEYTTNDAYIKIYLKHVTNSQWTTVPDWNTEVATADEVFTSSTYSIPTGTGWKEVPFTTPFTWNGTDNIAVFVEWDRSSTPTAAIGWGRSTTTSANATRVGSSSLNALVLLINSNRPLVQLTITPSGACAKPENLSMDDVTETTVDISWDASPDESDGYEWVVMAAGDDPDTDIPIENGSVQSGVTNVEVTGLTPDTNYDFYVKTLCAASQESDWSDLLSFTTDEEVCEAPTNLMFDEVTDTTVTFSWNEPSDTSNVEGYGWRIMFEGDNPITDVPVDEDMVLVGTDTATVTGLDPDTAYDLYLVSICDLATEFFSDFVFDSFTTEALGLNDNRLENFTFYPNPSWDNIQLQANTPIDAIEIFTIEGRKVLVRENQTNSFQINLTDFTPGVYLMKVTIGKETGAFRILKK